MIDAAFTIPVMFFACLVWTPPLDSVEGFSFEQRTTVDVGGPRTVQIDNVEWRVYDTFDDCYAIHAHGYALVHGKTVTFSRAFVYGK